MKHDVLGKWGEAYALQQLLGLGYAIKARNYKFNRMEIDLIMTDGQTLVVVVDILNVNSDNSNSKPTEVTSF